MEIEQTPAPIEAGDEAVAEHPVAPIEDQKPEAAETQGQDDSQPAPEPEGEGEQVSASKARRERRKAEVQRLKESEAQAKKELEDTKARLQRLEELAQASQPPKQEDYPNYDDFLAAKTAHSSMAALDARQKRELEQELERRNQEIQGIGQREQQEMAQNWADQAEDARTKYADFDRVVSAPDVPITPTMARMITASDVGADVAYYLGTNKAEAARIAQMSDLDAARSIGAIEARLSLPQVKTQSTTPDPVTPVRPKGTAQKRPEDMTHAEFTKWRESGGVVKL
jgi:hypothetical protein